MNFPSAPTSVRSSQIRKEGVSSALKVLSCQPLITAPYGPTLTPALSNTFLILTPWVSFACLGTLCEMIQNDIQYII